MKFVPLSEIINLVFHGVQWIDEWHRDKTLYPMIGQYLDALLEHLSRWTSISTFFCLSKQFHNNWPKIIHTSTSGRCNIIGNSVAWKVRQYAGHSFGKSKFTSDRTDHDNSERVSQPQKLNVPLFLHFSNIRFLGDGTYHAQTASTAEQLDACLTARLDVSVWNLNSACVTGPLLSWHCLARRHSKAYLGCCWIS